MTVSRRWAQRSSPQRLDVFTRWSLYIGFAALHITLLTGALMEVTYLPDPNPWCLAALALVIAAQTIACVALHRVGLTTMLGGPPPDRRLLVAAAALTAAAVLVAIWAIPDPPTGGDLSLVVFIAPLIGGTLTIAATPLLSRRALFLGILLGAAVTIGWYAITVVDDWPFQLFPGLVYTFLIGLYVVIYRFTEWGLVLMWENEESRAVQARLAVAEERLRFARDFHDVLGRNLTLIAVTSDLAAQLARRGDPDAVDKMLQVHSIAHESAREVREVVTGYRAADLDTELTGARSVLRAAGITTRIIGDSTCIPGDAQVAFAWVLREATTNIIRHSNATACTIELGTQPCTETGATDTVVLQIRNDGSPRPGPGHPPGHGLAGLRERLTALGGDFTAGPEPGGWFIVEARLPITRNAPVDAVEAAP